MKRWTSVPSKGVGAIEKGTRKNGGMFRVVLLIQAAGETD